VTYQGLLLSVCVTADFILIFLLSTFDSFYHMMHMQHTCIVRYIILPVVHMSITSHCSIEMAEWTDLVFGTGYCRIILHSFKRIQ